MKVALISEHASPVGADTGDRNVNVAALAAAMDARGVEVVSYTRRRGSSLPRRVPLAPRAGEHVDAGPPEPIPKDLPLPYVGSFAEKLEEAWSSWHPDVAHAHLCTETVSLTSITNDYGADEVFAYPELRPAEEVDR